ncbi:MAG: hypothetical protein JJE04_22520 [Acidobacteriia bacterium]|nr:hypothetical protein [Terriglobia bacterium]
MPASAFHKLCIASHLNGPGTNVSNMRLNPDGSVSALGGFMEITSARADERIFRFALRFQF